MPPRARKPTPEELAAAEQAAKDLELADQCDALEKARQIEEAQFNELQLQRVRYQADCLAVVRLRR